MPSGVVTESFPVQEVQGQIFMYHRCGGARQRALGRRVERSRASTQVTYTGAGSILNLRITIPSVGDVEIVQTQLPIAPLVQQVHFYWFADRRIPRFLVWYSVGNWVSQWRNDVRIWEEKAFSVPPRLSGDDGPVMRLRHWYRQFFPDPGNRGPE